MIRRLALSLRRYPQHFVRNQDVHRESPSETPPTDVLRQDFLDDFPGHVGEPEISPLKPRRQPQMVDPHQVQDGGVEVVDVDDLLDTVVT